MIFEKFLNQCPEQGSVDVRLTAYKEAFHKPTGQRGTYIHAYYFGKDIKGFHGFVRDNLVFSVEQHEISFDQSRVEFEMGKKAYQRYLDQVGHLNFQGEPCPNFESLNPKQQAGWIAAAKPL